MFKHDSNNKRWCRLWHSGYLEYGGIVDNLSNDTNSLITINLTWGIPAGYNYYNINTNNVFDIYKSYEDYRPVYNINNFIDLNKRYIISLTPLINADSIITKSDETTEVNIIPDNNVNINLEQLSTTIINKFSKNIIPGKFYDTEFLHGTFKDNIQQNIKNSLNYDNILNDIKVDLLNDITPYINNILSNDKVASEISNIISSILINNNISGDISSYILNYDNISSDISSYIMYNVNEDVNPVLNILLSNDIPEANSIKDRIIDVFEKNSDNILAKVQNNVSAQINSDVGTFITQDLSTDVINELKNSIIPQIITLVNNALKNTNTKPENAESENTKPENTESENMGYENMGYENTTEISDYISGETIDKILYPDEKNIFNNYILNEVTEITLTSFTIKPNSSIKAYSYYTAGYCLW
jgi:hypothetical protein